DRPFRSATASFVWPSVIRLSVYVRVPRAAQRKISRRALFARDAWTCVYCGATDVRLTLDHVVPRSRGGDSGWENVVTSCAPCNLRKGNRLLDEVAMALRKPPRPPAPALFIRLAAPSIPTHWRPYLEPYGLFAAPVVLSGRATFAGYIKLDDTATYLAMFDRYAGHGYDVSGLAVSTYERTLATSLDRGYPMGSLTPLGVGHRLLGTDTA